MKASKEKTKYGVLGAVVLLLGIIFMLPVFLIISNAFKPNKDILTNFIALPTSLYLDNFTEAMEIMNFWTVFRNTVLVTVSTVVIATLFSFFCAYGISHLKGKISTFFYMLFVLGQIIPFHTVMIAISVLATNAHLNNTLIGLVIFNSGFFTAFGVMTFVGFLKGIPRELEEAATLDGCGIWRTMMQVVFPLLVPTTVTVGVLFFLWSWNDFLLPSILNGDESLRTITVNLYMFKSSTSAQWNLFIAGLTLSMLPIVVIYILAQRYITSGLTSGAIK
ncbi:Inner membrane ABC transporter permease protein ycjP [uncultured Ruminococcus sp.]|uniref:Carbohydrate ABC transporter permease n=1 Tax=Massiliimalia timonensis TaxID=1987501 RepID=A0A8J6TY17_9FIRM|nr:carbohydrate ABC transporter permease [Massiliimalia timonensis]MBC8609537.1 carbohydrate ABC transporter permease [Massiliimalia timonensis]MBS7174691.1 carbohydrate ABC transporter permease [Clostridiales bacterium]SCH38847.1 Inner membrane ABC transporter permease protein ycjP [uncultured Ruminococcus sp.]SCH40512.1 Inner membrane ABC transporter permease protein ycjP [uncultured Clostridium sp.]